MTASDLLSRLDGVRKGGNGWRALCPAHDDHDPSLSIRAGDRGLLVKCWGGCTLDAITAALGVGVQDLFHDALDRNPYARHEATRQREIERGRRDRERIAEFREQGALEAADRVLASLTGIDISKWTDDQLRQAMNMAAAAHEIRMREERRQWMQ